MSYNIAGGVPMKRVSRYQLAAIALGACFVAWNPLHGTVRRAPVDIDLTGTWIFNETASRGLNQAARQAEGRRPGGPPGRGMPGMGMPDGTDMGGGSGMGPEGGGFPGGMHPRGGADSEGRRGTRPPMPEQIRNLALTQTDTAVVFAVPGRPDLVIVTDGRKRQMVWLDGITAKIKAEWTDNGLVVDRTPESGPAVRETYLRYPRSTRLTVETELKDSELPRTIKMVRVYDLVPAQENSTPLNAPW